MQIMSSALCLLPREVWKGYYGGNIVTASLYCSGVDAGMNEPGARAGADPGGKTSRVCTRMRDLLVLNS